MEMKKILGQLLKHIRKSKEKSAADLFNKCKLSTSYIYDIEAGKTSAPLETLEKLSNSLGIPFNVLLIRASLEMDLHSDSKLFTGIYHFGLWGLEKDYPEMKGFSVKG